MQQQYWLKYVGSSIDIANSAIVASAQHQCSLMYTSHLLMLQVLQAAQNALTFLDCSMHFFSHCDCYCAVKHGKRSSGTGVDIYTRIRILLAHDRHCVVFCHSFDIADPDKSSFPCLLSSSWHSSTCRPEFSCPTDCIEFLHRRLFVGLSGCNLHEYVHKCQYIFSASDAWPLACRDQMAGSDGDNALADQILNSHPIHNKV